MIFKTKDSKAMSDFRLEMHRDYPLAGVNVGGGIHAPSNVTATAEYSKVEVDMDGFSVCEAPDENPERT